MTRVPATDRKVGKLARDPCAAGFLDRARLDRARRGLRLVRRSSNREVAAYRCGAISCSRVSGPRKQSLLGGVAGALIGRVGVGAILACVVPAAIGFDWAMESDAAWSFAVGCGWGSQNRCGYWLVRDWVGQHYVFRSTWRAVNAPSGWPVSVGVGVERFGCGGVWLFLPDHSS